ncbi:hypothetical protein PoB_002203500 [Plakobranchus ocellatus]|uniref:Uncharacterized protein n=1 Tax=Plakobranchus ocellatus TaxID=259542 RepID=A0AAV3ZLU9_9GAST|nr:hypothetical protein PoB_002203500 [Plakobranchus ocellatus]
MVLLLSIAHIQVFQRIKRAQDTAPQEIARKFCSTHRSCCGREDNLQSETKDRMLQLASRKAVPVETNSILQGDPKRTRAHHVSVLRAEVGGREVDMMRDTGCEGIVVRKAIVEKNQWLAEKARVDLRTPDLCGEMKTLCIPDVIFDVTIGNVKAARSLVDLDMFVMVGAATRPLQVPTVESTVELIVTS